MIDKSEQRIKDPGIFALCAKKLPKNSTKVELWSNMSISHVWRALNLFSENEMVFSTCSKFRRSVADHEYETRSRIFVKKKTPATAKHMFTYISCIYSIFSISIAIAFSMLTESKKHKKATPNTNYCNHFNLNESVAQINSYCIVPFHFHLWSTIKVFQFSNSFLHFTWQAIYSTQLIFFPPCDCDFSFAFRGLNRNHFSFLLCFCWCSFYGCDSCIYYCFYICFICCCYCCDSVASCL